MANQSPFGSFAESFSSSITPFLVEKFKTDREMALKKIDREDADRKTALSMGFKALPLIKDPAAKQRMWDKFIHPHLYHFAGREGFPTKEEIDGMNIDFTNPSHNEFATACGKLFKDAEKTGNWEEGINTATNLYTTLIDPTEGEKEAYTRTQQQLAGGLAQTYSQGATPEQHARFTGLTGKPLSGFIPEAKKGTPLLTTEGYQYPDQAIGKMKPMTPKEPTGVDKKRLFDAINSYEQNPTPEKFMVLKDMAADQGYDLGKEDEIEEGGTLAAFKGWLKKKLGWSLPELKGKPVTRRKYKTAEDVRAAFAGGKIKKEEALNILRKDFGME